MNLFQLGNFVSHAGLRLPWKIECDSLTDDDWDTLAIIFASKFSYGPVEGIPRGGLKFAEALKRYSCFNNNKLLIADDVLTTGKSMEEYRAGRNAIGVVVFSREPYLPVWINSIWRFCL